MVYLFFFLCEERGMVVLILTKNSCRIMGGHLGVLYMTLTHMTCYMFVFRSAARPCCFHLNNVMSVVVDAPIRLQRALPSRSGPMCPYIVAFQMTKYNAWSS